MFSNDSNTEMNMKRESKAYSYKEQLEEMQLRREMEEKKRKEGIIKPPQYTPKQLEAIKNQRLKEEKIRTRLTELNATIANCVSMLESTSVGNPQELSHYYNNLLPAILERLASPLAAPYLTKLFVTLRLTVFPKNCYLGDLVAHVTLRLEKPQCDLDPAWEEEPLESAMIRTLGLIHEKTAKKNERFHLSAPTFSYMFPFVKLSLLSKHARRDDNFIHNGLQIISEYAKLSPETDGDENDSLYSPRLLPRKQMLDLLIKLISSTSGRVQTQVEACILDVANSSQANGATPATIEEINVLLDALQSPIEVVRDAALRGLSRMISEEPRFNDEDTLRISKRVWIAKFDVSFENRCG